MEYPRNCRMCLVAYKNDHIDLFDNTGQELQITMIISKYFWFEPREEDNFSNKICCNCWTSLRNFHEFYTSIRCAQETLLKVTQKTVEIAIKEEAEANRNIKEELVIDDNPLNDSHLEDSCSSSEDEIPLIHMKKEKRRSSCSTDEYSVVRKPHRKPYPTVPKKRGRKPKICSTGQLAPEEDFLEKKNRSALRYIGIRAPTDKGQIQQDNQEIREFISLNCQLCSISNLNSFLDVKLHYRRKHNVKGFVKCCKKKFFRRGTLLDHIEWHRNPNCFRCEICQKSFSNKRGKAHHKQNYHGSEEEKRFKCDICGKSFLKKYLLTNHMNIIHIPEEKKIHKCSHCGKGFALRSILMSHIRGIHEFANVNVCEICAKVFKSKAQWARHTLMEHSDEKPEKLQCSICQRWLKTEISLYGHMQRYHDDEPVKCHLCEKVSKNKYALRSHIRYVHETKREHECSVCSKAFRKPVELKEHMASHTGDILYVCPFCPTTFNSSGNMHAHKKKRHPIEWQMDKDRKMGRDHL